jgi:death-on-curing protein
MNEIAFFTTADLINIHARMITEYGGGDGLRDRGLLESAAAMPSASFGGQYLHDGIPTMAGAYLFHLCKNHPFVDGNKRVALAAAITFLLVNGHELNASKPAAEELTLGVADGSISKEEAIEFFRQHVRKAKPTGMRRRTAVKSARRTPPRRKKRG